MSKKTSECQEYEIMMCALSQLFLNFLNAVSGASPLDVSPVCNEYMEKYASLINQASNFPCD